MTKARIADQFGGIWYDKEDGTPVKVQVLRWRPEWGLSVCYDRTDGKGRYELLEKTFLEAFEQNASTEPQ